MCGESGTKCRKGNGSKKPSAVRYSPSVCSLSFTDSSPASGGAFWCALQAHRLASLLEGGGFCEAKDGRSQPALKGDSSRARPVGDAARGESGGIGSIASGSEARRPYSNQRCGCECNEQTEGLNRGCSCLRQPLSQSALRRIASSPAGEPFGWHYMPRYTS